VAYVAGTSFFVDGSGANTLRLNYSKEDADRLREGARRLGRAIRAGHPRG
jgi:DNA-binding transcriptional MocR family regulator